MSPGQRSALFREVNDRIYELLESTDPTLPGEFLCECGDDCDRRVELSPAEYAAFHTDPVVEPAQLRQRKEHAS